MESLFAPSPIITNIEKFDIVLLLFETELKKIVIINL